LSKGISTDSGRIPAIALPDKVFALGCPLTILPYYDSEGCSCRVTMCGWAALRATGVSLGKKRGKY